MIEPGRELDLAQKAIGAERRGELGVKNLEGYDAIVLHVLGEVDGGHPAFAQLSVDRI